MDLHHSVVELEVLLARIARGELDPDWSGAGAWDARRQQLLVDTVLRSWPIPPVVVAGDDDAEVVLDGRERLLALWRFTRDELPFAGRPTPGGEYLEQLDGMRHGQLPGRFRARLRRYGVPVVRVPAADDAEVRELMARWGASRPTASAPTAPAPAEPARVEPAAEPAAAEPAEPAAPTPPPAPRPSPRPAVVVPPPPVTPDAPPVPERPSFDQPTIPEQPVARARQDAPLFDGGRDVGDADEGTRRSAGAHRRAADDEPIFDELSAWFLDVAAPGRAAAEPTWTSPADPVYDAARSALHAPTPELTAAGLPIREPAARLAPGTIRPTVRSRPPRPADARAVGDHLTRLRTGTAAAREDLSGGASASGS